MSAGSTVDPRLVQQAAGEVRALTADIGRLAAQDISPDAFYRDALRATLKALAAVEASAWTRSAAGLLQRLAIAPHTPATDEAGNEHPAAGAVAAVFDDGLARAIAPGLAESQLNPTGYLLLVAPVMCDGQTVAVLHISQRRNATEEAQEGYRRFLQTVCRLAEGYHRRLAERQAHEQQHLWRQGLQLASTLHTDLRLDRTTMAVANEGRLLLACDRLSVAICRGSRIRVEAISGQDTIERRSNLVVALTALAQAVADGGERLVYAGDATHLPPQLESVVERYADLSHCRALVAQPLRRPTNDHADGPIGPTIGVLIAERLEEASLDKPFHERLALLQQQAAPALANAVEHQSLFLLPLWRTLGKSTAVLAARNLPKTLSVLIVLTAALLALLFIPGQFTIEAPGTLKPVVQRNVFARVDGTVQQVKVKNGDLVAAGDVLMELTNTDLQMSMTELVGQQTTAQEQLLAIQRASFDESGRMTVDQQNQLAGQRSELEQRLASLGERLKLYQQKLADLQVRSPITGQVTTWDVAHRLEQRPVTQGQVLVTVADPQSAWELELRMPEDRVGHLLEARQAGHEPEVSFVLATEPGVQYRGVVREVDLLSQVRGPEGSSLLVKVALDGEHLPPLRSGAEAVAKVDCGSRSLAYVWLHDLADFVQSRILFRL